MKYEIFEHTFSADRMRKNLKTLKNNLDISEKRITFAMFIPGNL